MPSQPPKGKTILIPILLRLKLKVREIKCHTLFWHFPKVAYPGSNWVDALFTSSLPCLQTHCTDPLFQKHKESWELSKTDPGTTECYTTRSPHSGSRPSLYHVGTKRGFAQFHLQELSEPRFKFLSFDTNLCPFHSVIYFNDKQLLWPGNHAHVYSKSWKHSCHSVLNGETEQRERAHCPRWPFSYYSTPPPPSHTHAPFFHKYHVMPLNSVEMKFLVNLHAQF